MPPSGIAARGKPTRPPGRSLLVPHSQPPGDERGRLLKAPEDEVLPRVPPS